MTQQYYICNEHNTIDSLMSFWTKNGSGYTCDINNAQKFTAEEADAIINDNVNGKFTKYPIQAVDNTAITCIHSVNNKYDLKSEMTRFELNNSEK